MDRTSISRRQFVRLGAGLGATAALVPMASLRTTNVGRTEEGRGMQFLDLKTCIQGDVLLPGEEGYDAERAGWNTIVEHHPAVIVVAAVPEDVAAAVRFAATVGIPVAVQSTGHGPSVPADGALLLNTRRMTELQIDAGTGMARIGPGSKWAPVVEQAAPHGLAPLVGSTPDLGAVGYLTGGGLPVLGRTFGFAADHVRAIELVTADGQLRRANADEHPDLFWAVRGGKGNFGVVTAVETGLMPVPRIYGGRLHFPGAAIREVLGTWLAWTASLPDELSSSLALWRYPDLPEVPEPVRGKFEVQIRIAHTGSAAEGERLIQPLRALGPTTDTVADMPYTRIGEVHNDPVDPAPIRDHGTLLRALDNQAVEPIAALADPGSDLPPGMVELRHLGGALGRVPAPPNAIGNRDAAFSLVLGMFTLPGQEEQVDSLQQRIIDGLQPWDTGRVFPNFLGTADTAPQRVRAAYRDADYERLVAIKAAYDAHNLFRVNHNIPPTA